MLFAPPSLLRVNAMPGWAASGGAGPSGTSGRQNSSGAGPSYTVQDVQHRVDAVKGIMCAPTLHSAAHRAARCAMAADGCWANSLSRARRQENVEVMLANIDKTEVLENKSAALADQAKTFHKTARATKRQMCKQNMKMNLIIFCVCGARPAHALSAPIALTHAG